MKLKNRENRGMLLILLLFYAKHENIIYNTLVRAGAKCVD